MSWSRVLLAAVLFPLLFASSASAVTRLPGKGVVWLPPAEINEDGDIELMEGDRIPYQVWLPRDSSFAIPPNSRLVLQRRGARAGSHWKKVDTLYKSGARRNWRKHRYVSDFGGLHLGEYFFRAAVLNRNGNVSYVSKKEPVFVYGPVEAGIPPGEDVPAASPAPAPAPPPQLSPVPVSDLCRSWIGYEGSEHVCEAGETQASGRVFSYAAETFVSAGGERTVAIQSPATTCRSLDLQIADVYPNERHRPKVVFTVVQRSVDGTSVEVQSGDLGSLHVNLDGGPWQLNGQAVQDYWAGAFTFGLNGIAQCYTKTGT